MNKKEWNKFSVGSPSDRKNWTNQDCVPFSSVAHITHISNSLPILIDQRIKCGLVFDESLLNDQRILVSWLSPKVWGAGYRYGNVRLKYKWNKIIKNKKFYWVESIAYGVPACRILVTDKRHCDLSEYDPKRKDGPWWYDLSTDKHYFNDHYCLEFMIEADLILTSDVTVDFVDHHDKFCSIHRYNPKDCSDLGLVSWYAAGIFLAHILARSINFSPKIFKKDKNNEKTPNTLIYCWSALCFNLTEMDNVSFVGEITHREEIAVALSRAVCNAFVNSNNEELRVLISKFKTKKHFSKTLAKLVASHFNLADWRDFLDFGRR